MMLMMLLLLLILASSLRLTDIRAVGNKAWTQEEVVQMVFPDVWDKNSIVCFIKTQLLPHKRLPFIEDYDVQFRSPFACDLVVYEKSIIGYVTYMSSYMYFDKDGIIVESSSERLQGVPEVTGLSFGHIVLNEPLPVDDADLFDEVMNITQQLGLYGIESERIDFDSLKNVTVSIDGGDIDVKLGAGAELDARISVLNDMLPKLRERGLKGSLDLSGYSDTEKNQISSFKIREEGAADSSR